MIVKKMKNFIILLLIITCFSQARSQSWIPIDSDRPGGEAITLVSSSTSASVVSLKISGFWVKPVQTPRGEAIVISAEGATPILQEGAPDLPKFTTSLIIPDDISYEVVVLDMKYRDFPAMNIAPSKGNLSREINPSSVPFKYGIAYTTNKYFPAEQASLREPYILRDHRGQTIVVNPFAYNPVTKTLRVYHELTIKVKAAAGSSSNVFKRKSTNNSLSTDFKSLYDRHFLNSPNQFKYTQVQEQGRMLVICHDDFVLQMQPFIEWKKLTGIPTEIVKVSTIGATNQAVRQYVTKYYREKGLTYLLLVGDHQHVPAVVDDELGGPSDMAYGYIDGSDHYPEILVGRFSAENPDEVAIQVKRTISYEKSPDSDSDWLSKGIGIASSEGPGDDEEYDWEHIRNIRSYLMRYTYNEVTELYDGDRGFKDLAGDPGYASLSSELNQGRGIINYTGHGNEMSWGTTGFNSSHVNMLTNTSKWPFIIAVACLNGDFTDKTCFAETWLRASSGNSPTGAVAAIMSTINQTWDPPMDAQDEMIHILTESIENNVKRTFGGVAVNGCLKMNDSYGIKGFSMTDTWVIFGDPSLQLRTALPSTLKVTHDNHIPIGSDALTIQCNEDGALACLTLKGEILGTAFVTNGTAVIKFPVIKEIGTVILTVTAFNTVPYQREINISRLDSPYITYNSVTINDSQGNNNQALDYGENVTLSLLLSNAGNEDVKNVLVKISSIDKHVSISDDTEIYPLIKANETISIPNGFGFSIAKDVPDGHQVEFAFTASSPKGTFTGTFKVEANSVVIATDGFIIDDSDGNKNGKVDRGETFFLTVKVRNTGGSAARDINCTLSTDEESLLIHQERLVIEHLGSKQLQEISFPITALPAAKDGQTAMIRFSSIAMHGFTTTDTIALVIGNKPVLVIDLDGNKNSGPEISRSLTNLGISHDYVTSWPQSIAPYKSLFICLGTFPFLSQLSSAQGQQVANFLNNDKSVYLEGGDVWNYDEKTAMHELFKINGEDDGSGDLLEIVGLNDSFLNGLSFAFSGDNKYIDHLLPEDSAFAIARNSHPEYYTSIAYDGGDYFTIGSSVEFGGLVDDYASGITKDSLMARYVEFLKITENDLNASFMAVDSITCQNDAIDFRDNSTGNIISREWTFAGGTPSSSTEINPVINYDQTGLYDVTLTISDGRNTISIVKKNYILVDNCTKTKENTLAGKVNIFPNPANREFTITFPGNNSILDINVFNSHGSLVFKKQSSENMVIVTLENAKPGVYQVIVNNGTDIAAQKLIITR